MLIYPAIDLYQGNAVRLYKGDYAQMTVYSDNPPEIGLDFISKGAKCIHLVDLEGAKTGQPPNFATVLAIKTATGAFCEIGGGIRTMEVIDRNLDSGLDRVILGTAAVTEPGFVEAAVKKYGDKVAVGFDLKDGFVAIKGWTEKSSLNAMAFAARMHEIGVKTLICTDISKDGAMEGANHSLYRTLKDRFSMNIIASGGVSSLEDVKKLAAMEIHGAIVGKAYYTGAMDLAQAIEVAK